MAENGNIAYITWISDTKTVMETEIEDRKTEIVIIFNHGLVRFLFLDFFNIYCILKM